MLEHVLSPMGKEKALGKFATGGVLTKLLGRTLACGCRMLLCLIATIHCALGAGLSITQLVLVVTFRCFAMVFGCCFMFACSQFMETASLIGIWHDVCSF